MGGNSTPERGMEFEIDGMFRTQRYYVLLNGPAGEELAQEPRPEWRTGLWMVMFSDDEIIQGAEPCRTYTNGGQVYTEWDEHNPMLFTKTNELETTIQHMEICVTCWKRLLN